MYFKIIKRTTIKELEDFEEIKKIRKYKIEIAGEKWKMYEENVLKEIEKGILNAQYNQVAKKIWVTKRYTI